MCFWLSCNYAHVLWTFNTTNRESYFPGMTCTKYPILGFSYIFMTKLHVHVLVFAHINYLIQHTPTYVSHSLLQVHMSKFFHQMWRSQITIFCSKNLIRLINLHVLASLMSVFMVTILRLELCLYVKHFKRILISCIFGNSGSAIMVS